MLLQVALFHTFLWLSNILLYIYIYHIFFIHSSVNGHLGCFHVLGIINSAAMNIGVHVSFQIMDIYSPDIYPVVGLLDHIVPLLLIFKELPYYSP